MTRDSSVRAARARVPGIARFAPVPGVARFSVSGAEGEGRLANLSVSGALIRNASQRVFPPLKLALTLRFIDGLADVLVDAVVVRETEDGFAVCFGTLDSRTQEILSDAVDRYGG